MTDLNFEKGKELKEAISFLHEKLKAFVQVQDLHGMYLSMEGIDPIHPLIYVQTHPQIAEPGQVLYTEMCKGELTVLINNIKSRLREKIDELETQFYDL